MSEEKFVRAGYASGPAEADQMIQILKENHVGAYARKGIMDVYMGSAAGGEDIMVLEKDQKKAEEIIRASKDIIVSTRKSRFEMPVWQKVLGCILLLLLVAALVLSII